MLAGCSSAVKVAGLPSPKEQIPKGKAIVATGAQMNIPARGQVIALATALQEWCLPNLDHGDRDRVGLFQQRPPSAGAPAHRSSTRCTRPRSSTRH